MSTKIQLKRGLEKDLPILSEGEFGFTTDTDKIFIGSSTGNVELLRKKDGIDSLIPNTQGWVSTDNQDTFQITNGKIIDVNLLNVYVSGLIQPNITLVNDTTFQLSEKISAGIDVYAEWFEVSIPATAGHHSTHESGGQDQIDITKLNNYSTLIGTPINVLIGLNDYSTYYTYTASGDIASETVKDSAQNVVCTTTYNYSSSQLITVVFTMNGTTVTSTYNYDSNGNLTSVVNVKS